MPLPIDNLTSVHLDAATDDPSQARVELLAMLNKLKEVIAVLDDGAGGGVNVDFLRGFGASTTPGANLIPVHSSDGYMELGPTTILGNILVVNPSATPLANTGIDIGNQGGQATSTFIDFHSGAVAVDYDSRIIATGGNGTAGKGTLEVISDVLLISSGLGTGSEGGEMRLKKPPTSTLSGDISIDAFGESIRFFEFGGTNRGVYLNLTQCIAGAGSLIWHSGNDGTGSGLNTDLVRGLAPDTAATPNTVVVRGASGQTSIRGTRFHGDGGSDSYFAAYETAFTQGNPAAQVVGADNTGSVLTATFDAISGPYSSPPGRAALVIGRNTDTGRSIAALGTLVASGADYAEYEIKSDHCGVVAKGQIIGFDASGKVTDKWANALSFGIKSTAPSYVGGDTWGTPDVIGCEYPVLPVEPCAPQCLPTPKSLRHARHRHNEAVRHADAAKSAFASIQKNADKEVFGQAKKNLAAAELALVEAAEILSDEEMRAKNAQDQIDSDHHAACEKYTADCETYKADKAIYDERLEAARSTVDRVAYSGKVPCNVEGATPGDYIVPVMTDGGGISGKAIAEQDITFAEYRRVVGRVRKILDDGRPEVAVIVH